MSYKNKSGYAAFKNHLVSKEEFHSKYIDIRKVPKDILDNIRGYEFVAVTKQGNIYDVSGWDYESDYLVISYTPSYSTFSLSRAKTQERTMKLSNAKLYVRREAIK